MDYPPSQALKQGRHISERLSNLCCTTITVFVYYTIDPYTDMVLSAGNEWLKPGAWGSVTKGRTYQKRRGRLRKLRRALALRLYMTLVCDRDEAFA